MSSAYAEEQNVTKGTTMIERGPDTATPGNGEDVDLDAASAFSAEQRAAMDKRLLREDELGLYSRERFLAALDGLITMDEYTEESVRHVAARVAEYRR